MQRRLFCQIELRQARGFSSRPESVTKYPQCSFLGRCCHRWINVPYGRRGRWRWRSSEKDVYKLGDKLQRMVGFRNLAVHRYRDPDIDIVEAVIRRNLDELLAFARIAQPHLS
jgi:Protein of unknown function DUF86